MITRFLYLKITAKQITRHFNFRLCKYMMVASGKASAILANEPGGSPAKVDSTIIKH